MRNYRMKTIVLWMLSVLLAFSLTGCVRAPDVKLPIADIMVTNGHLVVQNEAGFVWFDAKLTIDDKYTYTADMVPAGKSSMPLSDFVDDQGRPYKRGKLSIRHLQIDITDTLGKKRHFDW